MKVDRSSATVIATVTRIRREHVKLDTIEVATLANAILNRTEPYDVTEADVEAILADEREARAKQDGSA